MPVVCIGWIILFFFFFYSLALAVISIPLISLAPAYDYLKIVPFHFLQS